MRNLLFTLPPFHTLYLLKTGRYTICRNLVDGNAVFASKSVTVSRNEVLNFVGTRAIRSLSTSARKLEKLDNGDKREGSLIYYGSLTGRVKGIKVFTCVSSLGGIALQPLMIQHLINGDNLPLGVALMTCVGFFTFVTPFLIHLLTKKYVTEIQYNPASDTYTATVLSFFLRRIDFQFKVQDVKIPNILPMFTTMLIRGKPVFVISDCFLDMDHYIKMMGYDKPIDLKLGTVASVEDLEKSENKEKSEIM